jgi:glutathione peroxidase
MSDFTAETIDGREQPLSEYKGQVVLVVNTASQCGFTPQYGGLERLWDQYADDGFVVLGFPCNQFGGQEPGSDEQIGEFGTANYGVTFPMFAKVDVNGRDAHPLFAWLREQKGGLFGNRIRWNFTKFLVGRDGSVLKRVGPTTTPEKIAPHVETTLAD